MNAAQGDVEGARGRDIALRMLEQRLERLFPRTADLGGAAQLSQIVDGPRLVEDADGHTVIVLSAERQARGLLERALGGLPITQRQIGKADVESCDRTGR